MAYTKHLEIKLQIPTVSTPAGVEAQWVDDMKINAERINSKRKARIGSEGDFSSVIAAPSSEGFNPLVDSAFVSKSGKTAAQIITNQRVNLARSYNKYNDKLDYQFATVGVVPASRFKDVVTASSPAFAAGLAARTLRITGAKEDALGIAGIASMFLAGDKKAESYIRDGDALVAGAPTLVSLIANRSAMKAALAGKLVYTGVEWIKNNFDPTFATIMNLELDALMNAFRDPAVTDTFLYSSAVAYVKWEVDVVYGNILHILVGKTSA